MQQKLKAQRERMDTARAREERLRMRQISAEMDMRAAHNAQKSMVVEYQRQHADNRAPKIRRLHQRLAAEDAQKEAELDQLLKERLHRNGAYGIWAARCKLCAAEGHPMNHLYHRMNEEYM